MEGNYGYAGISFAGAAVPYIGDFAKLAKVGAVSVKAKGLVAGYTRTAKYGKALTNRARQELAKGFGRNVSRQYAAKAFGAGIRNAAVGGIAGAGIGGTIGYASGGGVLNGAISGGVNGAIGGFSSAYFRAKAYCFVEGTPVLAYVENQPVSIADIAAIPVHEGVDGRYSLTSIGLVLVTGWAVGQMYLARNEEIRNDNRSREHVLVDGRKRYVDDENGNLWFA